MSVGLNRLSFDENLPYGFSNKKAVGKMPNPLPSKVFLNLGCGQDVRDGFINIDLFSDDSRVVFGDVRQIELPDNSADLILASDILEHFSHRETQKILNEWHRVLKPNSELIIRCPSLKLQILAYANGVWNADIASYMIFGGQTNPGDYHCVGFDELSIKEKLHKAGFYVTEFSEENTPQDKGYINLNMTVRARKKAVAAELFEAEKANIVHTEPTHEQEKTEDSDDLFDLSMLEEIAGLDKPSDDIIAEAADSESKPQVNIVWEGSQFVWHSLALINREHCSNIIDSGGSNLTIIPYEPDAFAAEFSPKYKKLKAHDIRFKSEVSEDVARLPYIWIRHQWPPKPEPPKGAKWIIMQPWEFTTHREDFVEIFKNALEIWTPSNYSRQSFINSGIEFDKVQVIPNGINPKLFTPNGAKFQLQTDKRLKFLYVGGTIFRKGFDILLEVYLKTFTSDDDVVLVVKDMGGDTFYRGQTAKDFVLQAQQQANAPEIIYLDDAMTEEEIVSLYRACDVFVSPYRGEGFSLPTLEAMACGLPVVVTKGGATDDFTDMDCTWYLSANKISIGDTIDDKKLTAEAFLLEPSKDELAITLKYFLDNPTQIYSTGIIASAKARRDFNWKKATLKLLSRIDYWQKTNLSAIANDKLPEVNDDLISLGHAEKLFVSGKTQEAIKIFENLVNSDLLSNRDILHIYNRVVSIELANNNLDKAKEILDYISSYIGENIDTKFLRAKLLFEENAVTESLELMTEIFNTWNSDKYNCTLGIGLDEFMSFCGDVALSEDDLEGAHQYYTASLRLNPQNAAACFGAGLCFEKIGHEDAANKMFEWAEKLDPSYKREA